MTYIDDDMATADESSEQPDSAVAGSGPPGLPRWVKGVGIAVLLLVAVVVGVMLLGGHGPARHTGAAPW